MNSEDYVVYNINEEEIWTKPDIEVRFNTSGYLHNIWLVHKFRGNKLFDYLFIKR